MQVVDVNGNMFGYDHLEIIGADGKPKNIDNGLTSVGLSMPSAFTVSNSPLTSNGVIGVTGAGVVSQYIRGDGSLANFPTSTGGGSSISYYLNGSISQGTIGGVAYKEMNSVPVIGTGTDFTINANGYIAQFITDVGDPNKLLIPAGNWNFETYFSASSSGGSPRFYIELYKYDGAAFTLIASNSATPEYITGGTAIDLYFTALAVPTTTLLVTDRLAVRFYVIHSGRTITMHTENSHLCQIITTFSTGLTALNGLTSQTQYFATGTSGTDFNISSVTDTHTFNIPTASATNRGALSSANWSTFNNKQNAITLTTTGTGAATFISNVLNIPTPAAATFVSLTTTGSSGASTLISGVLNVPTYTLSGLGGVPSSRTLTINGTAYDLSADRSWSVGTVTSIATTGPITGGTITGSGTIGITQATISTDGYLNSTDWNIFNNKQPAGNYITALSGEATGSGPGTASVTLNNASVTAKVLTGVNVTGGSINASDSILTAFGKLQNQINGLIGSSIYQGVWNASTNTPALTSGVGTLGYYYIVNVAGSTNLDGITDWNVGDWAIFDGTAWQQVDNTDSVTSVNGQTGAVSLTSDNIPEGVTNLYFTNLRARQALTLTTSGSSGAATYSNTTGILNIPQYQSVLTNPVTGTGTANYVARWTSSSEIGTGVLYDNGTNVGIGTASPVGKLSVDGGDFRFNYGNTATNYYAWFNRNSAHDGGILLSRDNSTIDWQINNATSGNLWFYAYGLGAVALTMQRSNGFVGIGTTSPSFKLDVAGTFHVGDDATFNGTNTYINSSNVVVGNNSTDVVGVAGNTMYFPGNGNVGIGTTNPGAKLDIVSTGAGSEGLRVDGTGGGFAFVVKGGSDYTSHIRAGATIGVNYFITPPINGLIVEGNVGIGTTSPSYKLDLRSPLNTDTFAFVSGGPGSTKGGIYLGNDGTQYSSLWFDNATNDLVIRQNYGSGNLILGTASTEKMRITAAGNVGIGTTNPGAKLEVASSASGTTMLVGRANGNSSIKALSDAGGYLALDSTGGGTILNHYSSDNIWLVTGGGNVGINTSSPSEKLHVSGNIRVTGAYYDSNNQAGTSGQILSSTGSGTDWVSLSEISGVDGTGTANYVAKWSDTDTITNSQLFDNGTNVGIGTNSPNASYKLTISGSTYQVGTNSKIYVDNGGIGGASAILGVVGTSYGYLNTDGAYPFVFQTNSTERMRITSAGNVGIGTTAPGYVLEVNGGSDTFVASFINSSAAQSFIRVGDTSDANYSGLALYSDSGSGQIFKNGTGSNSWGGNASLNIYNSNGSIAFHPNNTANAMFIATSGNVGIGTTSPSQKLDISAGTNLNLGVSQLSLDNFSNEGIGITFSRTSSDADLMAIGVTDSDKLGLFSRSGIIFATAGSSFYSATSEKMRIDENGNVGIGTTSPSYKLDVVGEGRFGSNYKAIVGDDGTYGGYSTIGFGGTTNGYNRVFGATGTSDGLFLCAATGRDIHFRPNGGTADVFVVGANGYLYSNNYLFAYEDSSYNRFYRPNGAVGIYLGGAGDPGNYYDNTSHTFRSSGGGTNFGLWNSTGLGIGTTIPTSPLHIVKGGGARINLGDSQNTVAISSIEEVGDSAIGFYTQTTTERMRITSAGNVGIGTAAPGYRLEVNGGSDTFVASFINSSAAQSFIRVGDTSDANYSGLALYSDSGSGQMFKNGTGSNSWGGNASLNIYNSNGSIAFHPNNTANAMFIATTGNVGIGTTSPSQKLHVTGRALVDQFQYTKAINYSSGDLNSLITAGFYDGESMSNAPNSGWFWVTVETYSGDNNWIHQTATSFGSLNTANEVYTRVRSGSSWGAWKQLGDAASISGTTNYVSKFTSANTIGNSLIYDNGTNVGIGTTFPSGKLDVSGTVITTSTLNSTAGSYAIDHPGINTWKIGVTSTNSSTFHIGNDTGGSFVSKLLSITQAGNVGIGTTSPSQKLHVVGVGRFDSNIQIFGDWTTTYPIVQLLDTKSGGATWNIENGRNSNNLEFYSAGGAGTVFSVQHSTGNVGIGTTSPGAKIHVVGNQSILSNYGIGSFQAYNYQISTGTSVSDNQTFSLYLGRFGNGYHKVIFWASGYGTDTGASVEMTTNWGNSSAPKITTSTGLSIGSATYTLHYVRVGVGSYDLFIKYTAGMPTGYANTINYSILSNTGNGYTQFVYASGVTVPTLDSSNLVSSITSFDYNTGNVGIGTTNPANKLSISSGAFNNGVTVASILNTSSTQKAHVVYDTFLIQQDDAPTLRLYETLENLSTTISSDGGLTSFATTGEMGLFVAGSSTAPGWTGLNGIQAVRIKSNGNVGIGTTNPGAKLDIVSTGAGSEGLRVDGTGGGFAFVVKGGSDYTSHIRAGATIGVNYFTTPPINGLIVEGSVGIGTTSPGQKLHIAENNTTSYVASSVSLIQPDGGANLLIQNTGTGGFSSLRFVSLNGSNAIGYIGFDNSTASVGGDFVIGQRNGGSSYTEQVRITNAGNVGIGTTSPSTKLQVNGTFASNALWTDASSIAYWGNYSTAYGGLTWDTGYGMIFSSGGNALRFGTNGTNARMSIDTSGNVGIGTTAPAKILELSQAEPYLRFNPTAVSGAYLLGAADGKFYFTPESTYVPTMTLSSGNVGIGTASPNQSKLHILKSESGSNPAPVLRIGNQGSGYTSRMILTDETTNSANISYLGATQSLGFSVGPSLNQMILTSTGNVGIGTTAPAAKLEIYGTGSTSSTVNFLIKNSSGVKIIESFDDGLIRLNNTLNINQAIYINNGNSNVHYALDSHIFNVVNDSYQTIDFVTIKGNLGKPAMGVGTMSPNSSAILDLTSISKGFLPPRMTNTEMNAIASPAAGLVVYDTTNNKLTVYNGSSWVPLH